MADGKQPGLVKKLFFPAYTDAGSNDNFQPPHDDGRASESDAATAILDNRTTSRPQQHEVQYDGDTVGGYAPAADTIAERKRFFPDTDSPHSPQQAKLPQQRPSMAARSVSTTTRSGIRPFPTTSPRVQLRVTTDADSSLDLSSVTASSAAFSSVVGAVFLNESNDKKSKEDAHDKDPTPIKDNRTGGSTVFLPRLADFNDNSSEVVSDINSNASEMGTVIDLGASGRLADVEAMAALIERSDPTSLYEAESAASDVERAPAKDVPGLSLPTLEERRSDELPAQSKPRDNEGSVFREKMDAVFRNRQESPPPPPSDESHSSASALVSTAIRHIGSGVGNLGHNKSPSNLPLPYSAPATPQVVPPSPRVEDYLRSSLPLRSNAQPTSAAQVLRSPGSAVHFQSDGSRRQHRSALAPRFSHRFDRGLNRADEHADSRSNVRHANALSSPLRFARGCLSFDSTFDDKQPMKDTTPSIPESYPRSSSLQYPKRYHPSPSLSPHPVVQSRSWDISSGTSSMLAQTPRTPLDNAYRSFSFGKSPPKSSRINCRASAFRPAPLSRVRNTNEFSFQSIPGDTFSRETLNDISPAVANANPQNTLALRTPQRIEIEREDALDILACLVERSLAFDNELALSSRVVTIQEADENAYHEDVGESNVDSEKMVNSPASEIVELTEDDRVSTYADIGIRTVEAGDVLQSPPKNQRTPPMDLLQTDAFSPYLTDAVGVLRKISQDYERNMADGDFSEDEAMGHSMRMKAIDELLRSHTYAVEMRQAAKSASTWLRSIDRSDGASDERGSQLRDSKDADNSSVPNSAQVVSGEIHVSQTKEKMILNHCVGDERKSELFISTGEMDNTSLKAMLHSAELKSKEKEDLALRLNAELSKCRAEIGRLKSASHAEIIFSSPHRSILDDDDDSTSSAAASTTDNAVLNMLDTINASPIPRTHTERDTSIEASFIHSDVILEKRVERGSEEWSAIAEAKREAVLLKAALSQANETIRRLHEETIRRNSDDGDHVDAPVVSIDNPELSKELDDYKEAVERAKTSREVVAGTIHVAKGTSNSPGISDRRTINVQMLDGENFVTEWDDLAPPLPPPPDHGLRSPIVATLLQQWTSDASLHDALLSWLERILNGANPETVPPLTISSLDHQIRDGFTMHVLPLLLRRPDIHVDVKTRAHRRTSYDLSVAVTRPVLLEHGSTYFERNEASHQSAPSTEKVKKTHTMAFQASHGNHGLLEESMLADVGAPTLTHYKVSDYLHASSFAHSSDVGANSVAHSTATALVTNSSRRSRVSGHQRSEAPTGSASPGRIDDRDLAKMAGPLSRAMLGDDISASSSTTGGSSQKSAEQPGLMRSLGGAFGGLLRRKPIEPSLFQGEPYFDENDYIMQQHNAIPSFLRHAPPPSPSRVEEDGQPYHRVVSAPPGRIGLTFVEYRGHAMVSDVAPESPLSGWVFPSDILIAIDEVPVSGMRVREIVKLLTSRKSAQRALRVISSHAMNEFTLNTTTPSEAGALS